MHVFGSRRFPFVFVNSFKILSHDGSLRNDVGAEVVRQYRNQHARNHVGAQESLKRNSRGQHGDDFGVSSEFRGEGTEKVGVVGHPIHVIVENDGLQWCVILDERVEILVDVEDDGDGDDQQNREEVGADEFSDDIPVEPLDEGGFEFLQQAAEPTEGFSQPSSDFQCFAVFLDFAIFHCLFLTL